VRAMAEPNALCEPIATTSLYENEASGSSTVLTLEASKAEYAELQSPADDTVHAYRETAPFIVVQLRKRRGKVEVFLDGHLSKGKEEKRGDGTALLHDLYWHNGMHEDAEARTRVLSPIAVACAVEDGQRSIRNVKVSVWKSYLGIEATAPWQLLSEANLSPHHVSDTRCRVAGVPYPVAYYPQARVSIYVDRKGRQQAERERIQKLNAMLNHVVTVQTKRIGNIKPADLMTQSLVLGIMLTFASQYLSYRLGPIGNIGLMAAVKDLPRFLIANANSIAASKAAAAGTTGVAAAPMLAQYKEGIKLVGGIISSYVSLPKIKQPKTVRFTLKELGRTLEVIAAALTRPPPPTTTDPTLMIAHFSGKRSPFGRNERILWDWLASGGAAVKTEKLIEQHKFKSDDLIKQHKLGTRLHVVIDVQDAFECEVKTSRHELHCKRNDAYYLSEAASGTLDDLKRITKAVKELRKVLGPVSEPTPMEAVGNFVRSTIVRPFTAFKDLITKTVNAGTLQGALGDKNTTEAIFKAAGVDFKILDELAELDSSDVANAQKALTQFEQCFMEESGNGARLQQNIEIALLAKGKPLTEDNATYVCTRLLPQRVGHTNFTYLFRAGQKLSTQFVEVESLASVIREFSEYGDASESLQLATQSGFAYLRRFAPQWESRAATRVTLSCVCQKAPGFDNVTERAGAPLCSTLAITTPVDIHFAGAVSPVMEKSLRRIRFVVKRAQQKCDPSFLEALGLKHTREDLLACQVFGDLWADELIALHKSGEAQCPQMQMLEQASRRAASRLRALGTLLLELFTVLPQAESTTDDEDEIAPEVSDVAFRATLAGRDAALLIGKLLFTRDDFEIRSAMTPIVRQSAAAAVRAAAAFERNVPVHLPHEPLASLFGPRSECVAAFVRAGKLVSDDVAARCAIVAAYASARLLSKDEHTEALALLEANPQTPWRDPPKQSVNVMLAAMRYRMASLRMDYDPLEVVKSINTLNIDDTEDELVVVAKGSIGYAFYVPFGFGDARPAPTLPPVPVPMFGSIPVLGKHLKAAFESIAGVLKDGLTTDVAKCALHVHLMPHLRCTPPLGGGVQETNSMHPNVVQVRRMATDKCTEVHFLASRSRSNSLKLASTNGLEDSKDLADAHQCDRNTLEMAHEVSSIAWNAERVVQCVVAALASARGVNDIDTVCIELTIPHHAEYLETWYNKRPQQTLDTARGAHKESQTETQNALLSKNLASDKLQLSKGVLLLQQDPQDQQAGPGTFAQDPDATKKYKALKEAVETAEGLAKRADKEYEDAAQKESEAGASVKEAQTANEEANASTKRSQRLLLGSVGVGMAMLSALVDSANVQVKLVKVEPTPEGMTEDHNGINLDKITKQYAQCAAVRLSEACLLISQTC
jgi:hypothetical protein